MIDAGLFRRFYIGSAVLCALLCAASWLAWSSAKVTAGVAVGFVVGVLPFASWQIVGNLLNSRKGRFLAVLITLLKYGVLGVSLYFVLTRGWVHPWALLAGMLGASAVFFAVGISRITATLSGKVV